MRVGLLLSGGMDSLAIAWWKRPQWAVTINYGQKAAAAEELAAAQVCRELDIEHEVITVDCSSLGSGDMASQAVNPHGTTSDWWPYRNQLLVTLASMRAVARNVQVLLIGTVASDGESHLDGTPGFVNRIDDLLRYQEGGLQVVAPAISMTTADLIRTAEVPAGLLAWSHSCHKANLACGNCRGCNKYLATYAELGEAYVNA